MQYTSLNDISVVLKYPKFKQQICKIDFYIRMRLMTVRKFQFLRVCLENYLKRNNNTESKDLSNVMDVMGILRHHFGKLEYLS